MTEAKHPAAACVEIAVSVQVKVTCIGDFCEEM